MIFNDTFLNTGKGAEYMMRQFGFAVLKGEDMAYQTLDETLEPDSWYAWSMSDAPDGPYEYATSAIESMVDAHSPDYQKMLQCVLRTYNLVLGA